MNGPGIAVHVDQLAILNHRRRPTGAHDGRDAVFARDDRTVAQDAAGVRDDASRRREEGDP